VLRIGLNLLHAVPDIGGAWNYIANLLEQVAETDRTNEYVAFVTAASAPLVPRQANFQLAFMPVRAGVRGQRVLFEHSVLQAVAWRRRLNCMHWFANGQGIVNAAPAVVTIYDLQPFREIFPFSRAKGMYLRWRLRATARHAAMLLPMSRATAHDLHSLFDVDEGRLTVVPPVLEPVFRPPHPEIINRFRKKHSLPDRFFLYVAHMYPHKNHARLLEAYKAFRSEVPDAWPLVLRGDDQGMAEPIVPHIARLGLSNDVRLILWLPRAELPALYGAASALVFPSVYEGGGLPVLEAMACGCPVAASDIPAVREFAGTAVEYFDPLSVADLERVLVSMSVQEGLRHRLRRDGLIRSAEFRQRIAHRVIEAYERASCAPSKAKGGRPGGRSAASVC
jgi:glycosyltransferase involved in cell wall biosynthesis